MLLACYSKKILKDNNNYLQASFNNKELLVGIVEKGARGRIVSTPFFYLSELFLKYWRHLNTIVPFVRIQLQLSAGILFASCNFTKSESLLVAVGEV